MGLTKAQLEALNDSSFPNNNAGYITPTILRDYNDAVIGNTVNQDVYTTDSASFNSRIQAITSSATVNTGSLVTTASFNAYTASTNSEISAIESFTASVSTSVGLLQTFSGSQYKADSSSFDTRINAFASSSVPAGTVSSSAQISELGFVTTSSFNSYTQSTNQFTASISTSVGLLQTFSASSDSRYVRNSQTSSMAVSSSLYSVTASYAVFAQTASEARNVVIVARNGNQSTLGAGTVVRITSATGDNPIFNTSSFTSEALSSNTLGILRTSIASGADGEVVVNGIVLGVNTDPSNGYVAGDVIYLSSSGQFTRTQPQAPQQTVTLGEVLRAQQNNGSIYVNISNGWELQELHNVQINTPQTNDLLAYESSSYGLWKNKSFSSLGLATTSSVNDLSASIYQTDATQSNAITNNSSSQALLNSTFATTGSNTFVGNQTITGSVTISGSTTSDLTVVGQIFVSSSAATGGTAVPKITVSGSAGTTTINRNSITTRNATNQAVLNPSFTAANVLATNDEIGFSVDPVGGGVGGWTTGPAIYVNNDAGDTYPAAFGFQDKANYTDGRVTVLTPLVVSAGIIGNTIITGSLILSSSNAVELNVIGNQIITGSLILSSSAATELQVIGGVEITGSVAGNITALSVASSTASIDFNLGTFFTLTIPSSSVTYITGSNLKPGMTANIVLTQQATTGSVRFESSLFKFPSGSINTGSAVASAVDLVSVMSVNTTTLLSVGANRLI